MSSANLEVVNEYSGDGQLYASDGTVRACRFELVQYPDARIWIECRATSFDPISPTKNPIIRFTGVTSGGDLLTTEWGLQFIHERRDYTAGSQRLVLLCDRVTVGNRMRPGAVYRFELVNLIIADPKNDMDVPSFDCSIQTESGPLSIRVAQLDDFIDRWSEIRYRKSVLVMATLSISRPVDISESEIDSVVNEVCFLLSVARGCKVNWVSRDCLDALGKTIWREFGHRDTRPFTPLPLGWTGTNAIRITNLPGFIQETFSIFRERRLRYGLETVIDQWLDGRHETDRSRGRALKLVVVIETLRTNVLYRDADASHAIIAESDWNRVVDILLPMAKDFLLNTLNQDSTTILQLCSVDKWNAINRKSFRSELRSLLKDLSITIDNTSISLFIESRNKLVHEGRYLIEADPEGMCQRYSSGPKTYMYEYAFLVHFVDRVVIGAVGYGLQPEPKL